MAVSCKKDDHAPVTGQLQLFAATANGGTLNLTDATANSSIESNAAFVLSWSAAVDTITAKASIVFKNGQTTFPAKYTFQDSFKKVQITPQSPLPPNCTCQLVVSDQLKGKSGETFPGIVIGFTTVPAVIKTTAFRISGKAVDFSQRVMDVALTLDIEVDFSAALNPQSVSSQHIFVTGAKSLNLSIELINQNKTIRITSPDPLKDLSRHLLTMSSLSGAEGETIASIVKTFYTTLSPDPKFPVITDDELLTLVQQQTFKYFWDFGHPASGMARERNTSGDIVTSGGSGFGIMSIIVGIERGFITRAEGVSRLDKIVTFLEKADRFHGAWSHWIDGNTGKVVPFGTKDDGGDLVETSFLMQGLITFRQYLNPADQTEADLIARVNTLWESVEWDWYRKDNQSVLYWHWSPNYNWDMNFPLYGYFEEQITYILAAASPGHSIPKSVYTAGYGLNGAIKTGNTYYGYKLPLGSPSPLFWVQYSYLGMDPHFSDDYANYWEQNVNASLINHNFCVANPNHYVGYSDACWGLTASDNQNGYNAHSPGNDLGVITPTAALSSFPYTPDESMKALKFFYYSLGDRLWGPYGFYDAFNLTAGWTADSYLAIDQGPIVVMIENHRSGLLWSLFASAPEIQAAKTKLGFQ
ncbi:MAG: hypothetical protein K1X47_13045 [Cyclobacteriaceae bacterium]|nr:hypothetical protein [Cyclobacteriaceae bacterium]